MAWDGLQKTLGEMLAKEPDERVFALLARLEQLERLDAESIKAIDIDS